jgi:AraC-like DNA-binding protein/predicted small integral membrane protein
VKFWFQITIPALPLVCLESCSLKKNRSGIYLGFYFALLGLYIFIRYFWFISQSEYSIFSNELFISSYVIIMIWFSGPLFYWFVRSNLVKDFRFRKIDIWHILPVMVFLLIYLYQKVQIFPGEKISLLPVFQNTGTIFPDATGYFNGKHSPFLMYLSIPVIILCYMFWSAGLFIKSLRQKEEPSLPSQYQPVIVSIGFLLGFIILLVVSQALVLLMFFRSGGLDAHYIHNLLPVLSGLEIAGLFIAPLLFPGILYRLPLFTGSELEFSQTSDVESLCEDVSNNHNAILGADYLCSIGEKADECMRELQPYVHADFSLAQLAVMIQVPIHHLSCYFRKEKKQSFQEYRNEWRVEHAKALIKEGLADGITLEAIGFRSGFLNRNAFRNTFLKVEGILPSAFALKAKK